MKNDKLLKVILIILTVSVLFGCEKSEGSVVKVSPKKFIDTVYDIYGEELNLTEYDEEYREIANVSNGTRGTTESALIYRIYDDNDDARIAFESYYDEFLEVQAENDEEIIMEKQDDYGYIIYDDVCEESVVLVTCDGDTPSRRYGCIYYYDSTLIVINNLDMLFDEDIDQTVELLDELSLPHI